MIKNIIFLFLISCTAGLSQSWTKENVTIYETFEELEPLLKTNTEDITIINFWATWCGPCVMELPYFEDLQKSFEGTNNKVVLVSLDFKKSIETTFLPFLNKHDIQSEVILLLDGKAHKWIDKVDPSWSGAIPITIFKKGDKYLFKESVFHSVDELHENIKALNNL